MINMINKKILAFLLLLPMPVLSAVIVGEIKLSPPSPLSYNGPSGGVEVGQPIGNGWMGERIVRTVFGCSGGMGCINSAYIYPVSAPVSGVSYVESGRSYNIYPTGVPGIGYTIGVRDPNSYVYIPGNYPSTKTFPFGGRPVADDLGYAAKLRFVTTGQRLATGSYLIPAQRIARLGATVYGRNENSYLSINAVRINVTATGCDISSSTVQSIMLGEVSDKAFTTIGSNAGESSINLSVTCDNNVALHGVITDQTDTANRSNILKLTRTSAARGVGIQLFVNNSSTPVSFGPDQSVSGVQNQFYIDTATSDGQVINLPVKAKYVKTGDITPGSADGIASVTFSYQ